MTEQEIVPMNTSDERIMAGFAYLLGPLIAFILWVTQKDRSKFVRFQALQAILFDLSLLVAWLLFIFLTIAVIWGGILLGGGLTMLLAVQESSSSPVVLLPTILGVLPMFCFPAGFLVFFALVLLKLIGAVNVFLGKEWRFPLVGKLTEKLLAS